MRVCRDLSFFAGDWLHRGSFLCLALSVALVSLSIAASQILLGASVAAFFVDRWRRPARPYRFPPFTWPLLALLAWTVIAALFSSHLMLNLWSLKKFVLFLVVFLVPAVMGSKGARIWTYRIVIAAGAVAAARGLIQYILLPNRDINHRITGFMSHWMTFAGLLMLVLVAIAAYVLCFGIRKSWWAILLGILVAAGIYLSQTRSTLLGASAAIVVLLLLGKRYCAIAGVAGILALVYFVSPAGMQHRLLAGFDLNDPHTRPRVELLGIAIGMIRDNPWIGVGPGSVALEARHYRGSADFPEGTYMHMHNNFLQIAAERGIPGLALWIWFMALLVLDALRRLRCLSGRKVFPLPSDPGAEDLFVATSAVGASIALLVAGLFEYNFGDSEVLILFLFMAGAPYANLMPAQGAGTNHGTLLAACPAEKTRA